MISSWFRRRPVQLLLLFVIFARVLIVGLHLARPDVSSRAAPQVPFDCAARQPTRHGPPQGDLRANLPIVTSPVAALFPELAHAPTDWRQFAPTQITATPVPGHRVTFTAVSIERDGDTTIWRGTSEISGAALVGIGSHAGWDAILTIPGADEYEIHVRGDRAAVVEKNPGRDHCGHEGEVALQADRLAASSIALPATPQAAAVESSTVSTVDVLFFYDADTLAAATARAPDGNGTSLIESILRARLALGNAVLANSGVTNLQWRYIGSCLVPAYTRTGKLTDDLNTMINPATEAGRFMIAKAVEFGADQAVLLVTGPADYSGLAFVPGHQAVVSWDAGYETLAHELAHNFGCQHDRQTDQAPDGNGLYGYGYRFTFAGRDCGDIMSYASYRFPLFSNPSLSVDLSTYVVGLPAGQVAFGVAGGQPQAADEARVLRENAATMAACRPTVLVSAPSISIQPAETSATAGESIALEVAAVGGALTYQWRKDGTLLAGANGSTYASTNATPADAGRYDCIVTNLLGTVTTSAVSLNITMAKGRTIAAAPTGGRLVNLSARAQIGTGANILIGGLAIEGGRAEILVRAIGPALGGFGVAGTLSDPQLKAYDASGKILAENDDWSTGSRAAEIASTAAELGAFALAATAKDAALLLTVDPGCYSFHVSGTNAGTGIGLLEIYLVDNPALPGRLVNLSARAFVGTDDGVLITGFVTRGGAQVLVRGIGPTLADFGVPGTVARPLLEVYAGAALTDRVQEWGTTYAQTAATALFRKVGAFPLPVDSSDSIAVLNLAGDAVRTVQIKGDDRRTGIALAEVYLVRP